MKNIAFALVACALAPAVCPAQDQAAQPKPTPVRYRSLEDANRRIRELKADNEALQIQNENAQLHQMSEDYDRAHPVPYPYCYPYPGPVYPGWGGWGGYHYHDYPADVHHHYHHHHHHHH